MHTSSKINELGHKNVTLLKQVLKPASQEVSAPTQKFNMASNITSSAEYSNC